jgi:hypothetical protein
MSALLLLLAGACEVAAQQSSQNSARESVHEWPPLPVTGFVSGRWASETDVADRNAVFVAKSRGGVYIGRPLGIVIPQYAYLIEQSGRKRPVIVVQAERADSMSLVGLRDLGGKELIATLGELELLGRKPPN